jgi:phage host-nuclease inhibitor protein Gam
MQENILYTNMKYHNQMENLKNNLKNVEKKMQDLCTQLEGSLDLVICDELKKVET